MTQHTHREYVEGCFRCDLSRVESAHDDIAPVPAVPERSDFPTKSEGPIALQEERDARVEGDVEALTLHDHFDGRITLRVAQPQPQYGTVQLNAEYKGEIISVDVNAAELVAALSAVTTALTARDAALVERVRGEVVQAVEVVLDEWPVHPNSQPIGQGTEYRRAVTQCANAIRAALAPFTKGDTNDG